MWGHSEILKLVIIKGVQYWATSMYTYIYVCESVTIAYSWNKIVNVKKLHVDSLIQWTYRFTRGFKCNDCIEGDSSVLLFLLYIIVDTYVLYSVSRDNLCFTWRPTYIISRKTCLFTCSVLYKFIQNWKA